LTACFAARASYRADVAGAVVATAGPCTAITAITALGVPVLSAASVAVVVAVVVADTLSAVACAAVTSLLVLITWPAVPCPRPLMAVATDVTFLSLVGLHLVLALLCAAHPVLIVHCCSLCKSLSLRSVGDIARIPVHTLRGVLLSISIAVGGLSFAALAATCGSFIVYGAPLSPWALTTSTTSSFNAVYAAAVAAY